MSIMLMSNRRPSLPATITATANGRPRQRRERASAMAVPTWRGATRLIRGTPRPLSAAAVDAGRVRLQRMRKAVDHGKNASNTAMR